MIFTRLGYENGVLKYITNTIFKYELYICTCIAIIKFYNFPFLFKKEKRKKM